MIEISPFGCACARSDVGVETNDAAENHSHDQEYRHNDLQEVIEHHLYEIAEGVDEGISHAAALACAVTGNAKTAGRC